MVACVGRRGWLRVLVVACVTSLACGPTWGEVSSSDTSAWDVRVGPVWRLGGEVKSCLVPERLTATIQRYETCQQGDNLNPLTGYANRKYDDGFVFIDPGTADPESYIPGLTWYWGYQSDSQYQNGELAFHGGQSDRHTIQTLQVSADEHSEDDSAFGLDLSASRSLWRLGAVQVGVEAGCAWFAERSYSYEGRQAVASERTTHQQYVDYYGGNQYTPESGPYSGSYDGPGPLIRNEPDRRESVVSYDHESVWMADYAVDTKVRHMEFRLGPNASLSLSDRVDVRVAPMLLAAYVDAESTTRVAVESPSAGTLVEEARTETSEWVWGMGLVVGADVELGRGWTVGVQVDRTWWDEGVSVNASPFETTVDLGEWSATATVGWRF